MARCGIRYGVLEYDTGKLVLAFRLQLGVYEERTKTHTLLRRVMNLVTAKTRSRCRPRACQRGGLEGLVHMFHADAGADAGVDVGAVHAPSSMLHAEAFMLKLSCYSVRSTDNVLAQGFLMARAVELSSAWL